MITPEQFKEAQKKAQAFKTNENFFKVDFSGVVLVLPYKEGMAFIASLAHAESIEGDWGKKRLEDFNMKCMEITVIPAKERERYKIAALLDISIDDVKEAEKYNQANSPNF
jgi:hypothetical protein